MSTVYTMARTSDLLPGTLDLLERIQSGRRQLAVEAREWDRMAHAIGRVMKLA